jgi:hypothetical protein
MQLIYFYNRIQTPGLKKLKVLRNLPFLSVNLSSLFFKKSFFIIQSDYSGFLIPALNLSMWRLDFLKHRCCTYNRVDRLGGSDWLPKKYGSAYKCFLPPLSWTHTFPHVDFACLLSTFSKLWDQTQCTYDEILSQYHQPPGLDTSNPWCLW